MTDVYRAQAFGVLSRLAITPALPARYVLQAGEDRLTLNNWLGESLTLRFTGRICCVNCGRRIRKSFRGHCYECFTTLASCDNCIMRPEACHYFQGTCREPGWGERHCFAPHIVYLANSSGLKVGITKPSQVPVRWLDQGAIQALPILQVDSRQQSGFVEALFRTRVSDRTAWQRMLKGPTEPIDLLARRDTLLTELAPGLAELRSRFGEQAIRVHHETTVAHFDYPILQLPAKIRSLSFDRQSRVGGQLLGMKGQYLMFDSGVINLRRFAGYEIEALAEPALEQQHSLSI